jgi:hypothetical protein
VIALIRETQHRKQLARSIRRFVARQAEYLHRRFDRIGECRHVREMLNESPAA